MERPFTPERLAERWECSAEHIRKLLSSGRLHGFKLGGKLWRISAGEVERFECQTTDLGSSKDDGSPFGTKAESAVVGALKQQHRLRREQRLGHLPENVTRFYDHKTD